MIDDEINYARIFILLARDVSEALILRRGPSKWVQLISWNTADDTFVYGHWFKGRLYQRRCDLSPDGTKFIYFASKFSGRTIKDKEYTYAWTAISKPPYLTALALWPKGDCWHGGGLFVNNETVWLNHKPEVAKAHDNHQPTGLEIIDNPDAYGEDSPIYERKLVRDGWKLEQRGVYKHLLSGGWSTENPEVWSKHNKMLNHTLNVKEVEVNFSKKNGPYIEEFNLFDHNKSFVTQLTEVTWADWDQQNRLVFIRNGCLYTLIDNVEKLIINLNDEKPEGKVAPDWARKW